MFDTLETCAGTDKFICGPSFEFGPDADIAGAGVRFLRYTWPIAY
jgi:hypothetical protein